MHEVLVNRLGGLSLPRKSVVRLTDRPDMTLDVYRGRKTTMQQQQQQWSQEVGRVGGSKNCFATFPHRPDSDPPPQQDLYLRYYSLMISFSYNCCLYQLLDHMQMVAVWDLDFTSFWQFDIIFCSVLEQVMSI